MKPRLFNAFIAALSLTRATPGDEEQFFRSMEFDRASINEDARTVELSFSSEAEVERYFGTEVLDHATASVRMQRLNEGAPLLVNHDRDDQVGVIENASIDGKKKRGRALVRFGKSKRAEEIFQDVKDGIRRLVSVGYRIFKVVTETKTGGVETVRVVDWEPYEISLVSIPADTSVGVGRSGEQPTQPLSNNNLRFMNRAQLIAALRARGLTFSDSATDAELQSQLDRSLASDPALPINPPEQPGNGNRGPPSPVVEVRSEAPPQLPAGNTAERAIASERQRITDIRTIADQVGRNGVTIDVARAISDGITADQFRERALEGLLARQTGYVAGNPADLSRQEQRDLSGFSITRGIAALINQTPLTGLELEMHQEAQREARAAGLALRGQFTIPTVVLNHGRRDMTATGGTNGDQGGVAIATSLGSFIELLYSKMVLRGLGAQYMTGLVGNFDLPRVVTGATVAKKTENEAATESSPTMDKLTMSPNRAAGFVELSKQLLLQNNQSVEGIVRNDLATILALLMELGAINGGGTNEPVGVMQTAGIGSVVGGANGAAPTYANIIALETAVAAANADVGTMAYLTNTKVRGKLKTTQKFADTNGAPVWGEGSTPLNGYRAEVTNQVPSNLTKGTSNGVASAILFGNWSDLIVGQWGGIDISVNPFIKDTEGLVRITADTYYDAVVRRAASFAAMVDALTV